jgi:hypothetical protein
MHEQLINLTLQIHVLQQLWKVVSQQIVVNSPNQMWWKKVQSEQSVSFNACVEAQSGYFENFTESAGGGNSGTMLEKTHFHVIW